MKPKKSFLMKLDTSMRVAIILTLISALIGITILYHSGNLRLTGSFSATDEKISYYQNLTKYITICKENNFDSYIDTRCKTLYGDDCIWCDKKTNTSTVEKQFLI